MTNRLLLVARKDARDSIRDRTLYVIGVLFVLAGLALGYLVGSSRAAPPEAIPTFGVVAMVFVGSLSAVALSYNGVVGKRESGELRVLLSLPLSRLEVVGGTLLGRFAVVGGATVAALLLATAIALVMGGSIAAELLVVALVAALVVVALFVSLAVALSAAVSGTTAAGVGAFGLFITLVFRIWELIPLVVRYAINGFRLPPETPVWARVWGQVSPLAGLRNALEAVAPELAGSFGGYAASVSDPSAVFVQPWFGAVVVAAWLVVPLAAGVRQFLGADL